VIQFLQLVVSGLAVGAIYGLVALGFVLVFKSTDIFSFAQGDLVMVGAYLGFGVLTVLHVPLWIAVIITLLLAALLGLGIQRFVFKPLFGSPLLTMVMATIALSLIIRGLVVIVWGPGAQQYPSTIPNAALNFFGVRVSTVDLVIMAVAGVAILIFGLFFRFSNAGLHMRAIAENPEAAAVVGINQNRMFSLAIAIGTVTAAVGGVLLANLQVLSPQLSEIGLLAFPAAVLGGMRSIPGAVVGGLIIGVLGQLSIGYADGSASTAITFAVLLLVLLVRPQGLFGKREAVRA
jgi:branched-chain amino acid transport system permease protein